MTELSLVGLPIDATSNAGTDLFYHYHNGQQHVVLHLGKELQTEVKRRWLASVTRPGNAIGNVLGSQGFAILAPHWSARKLADVVICFGAYPARPRHSQFSKMIGLEVAQLEAHVGIGCKQTFVDSHSCLLPDNEPNILVALAGKWTAEPAVGYIATWRQMPGRGEPVEAELSRPDVDALRLGRSFGCLNDAAVMSGQDISVGQAHQSELSRQRIGFQAEQVEAAIWFEQFLTLIGILGRIYLKTRVSLEDAYLITQTQPPMFRIHHAHQKGNDNWRRLMRNATVRINRLSTAHHFSPYGAVCYDA